MRKLKKLLDITIFVAIRSLIRAGQSPDQAHDRAIYAILFPLLPVLGCSGPLLFNFSKGQTSILGFLLITFVYILLSVYVNRKERWRNIYERYRNTKYNATKYLVWWWIYFLTGPIACVMMVFYMAMRNNGDLPEWLIFN